MYRGTPYLNRKIKQRQEDRSMEFHLNNLYNIRPRTSTIEGTGEVLINNRKKQLQKEARYTQIQRENRILLTKISSIMGKQKNSQSQHKNHNKVNKSLNENFRRRQMQNIQIQNAKMLKRLQQRKPNYETQKFKQSWRKQKLVIQNHTNYPFIFNNQRRKRSSISQIGSRNLQSRNNVVELCRMRIIDGVHFLVTVKLDNTKLQIIGDTKQDSEIKVIQIQRKQGMDFIEQQCNGRIERIFNCLRYDKNEEIMYLVANDMQTQDKDTKQSKELRTRQENPEFNFQNVPDIPIQVTNGETNRKYWVEVPSRKTTQRLSSEDNHQNQSYLQKEESKKSQKNIQREQKQIFKNQTFNRNQKTETDKCVSEQEQQITVNDQKEQSPLKEERQNSNIEDNEQVVQNKVSNPNVNEQSYHEDEFYEQDYSQKNE